MTANVDNMAAPTNASKWRMGFDLAFKGLNPDLCISPQEIAPFYSPLSWQY